MFAPKMARSAATSRIPTSIAINTIMIDALTECSTHRASFDRLSRFSSYQRRKGPATTTWSTAARSRKHASAAAMLMLNSSVLCAGVCARTGSERRKDAVTGSERSLLSTSMAAASATTTRPTATFAMRRPWYRLRSRAFVSVPRCACVPLAIEPTRSPLPHPGARKRVGGGRNGAAAPPAGAPADRRSNVTTLGA